MFNNSLPKHKLWSEHINYNVNKKGHNKIAQMYYDFRKIPEMYASPSKLKPTFRSHTRQTVILAFKYCNIKRKTRKFQCFTLPISVDKAVRVELGTKP